MLKLTVSFSMYTEPANISLVSYPSSSIVAGNSVTLTCTISLPTGVTDTPSFQWEGPGVTPTPTDPTSSEGMVSSTLVLHEVATSQAGLYNCTASLRGSIDNSTALIVQSRSTHFFRCLHWCLHNIFPYSCSSYSCCYCKW